LLNLGGKVKTTASGGSTARIYRVSTTKWGAKIGAHAATHAGRFT
jgi:hypothetical protein